MNKSGMNVGPGRGGAGSKADTSEFQPLDQHRKDLRSDGSMLGSSLQSHQFSSFDIEAASSTAGSSWRIGMPWFGSANRKNRLRGSLDNMSSEHLYHGGLMMSGSDQSRAVRNQANATTSRTRTDMNTRLTFGSDDDSMASFKESEWTPQDSAYGAACPVCGFIPKHVRRMIEFSLITGMAIGFVYLLVTTSIHISNDRTKFLNRNSTSTSDYRSGQIALDDDLYVEYGQNQNDDLMDDLVDDDGRANQNDDDNNDGNGRVLGKADRLLFR